MTASPGSWKVPVETAWGTFQAEFTVHGLARLVFPSGTRSGRAAPLDTLPSQVRRWCEVTAQALVRVLTGQSPGRMPPLDWAGATAFQRRVWQALLEIPPGRTTTYGVLARRIRRARASRAVGAACGANPWPVLVPCHRVVSANGGLGGFSAGIQWKRRLLKAEGWLELKP